MIKLAEYKDALVAIELLRSFLQETSYKQAERASRNTEHLAKIVWMAQQYGYLWLAYVDDEPVGLLMAVKEPNIWFPEAHELRELVWYVLPEHRDSSIGGRLFLAYCQKAEQLLKDQKIQGYFTTKMATTAGIDLEKRGFRQTESTYIKEL
jgi:hypothetical protein